MIMNVASFDLLADKYDKIWGLPSIIMGEVIRVLMDELNGHETILDAGIGTGRFAKPLQDKGFKVVGIDASQGMLRKAIEKGMYNLVKGDVCKLPFKDSSFDATISIYLLNLIKEWEAALQEIARVTRHTMISIVHECPLDPIRKAYYEALKKRRHVPTELGIEEQKLAEIIKPRKCILAASYDGKVNSDEVLSLLDERTYSWEVAEEIHKQIMHELKTRFIGKIPRHYDINILIWNIDDLWTYFKSK